MPPAPSPDPAVPAGVVRPTTGRSVLRGGAWNVLAALLPQLFVVVVSATAARLLGPTAMGRLSFIAFVQISVVALVSTGVGVAVMRGVAAATGAGEGGQARGLVRWAVRVTALLAVLASGLVGLGALLAEGEERTAWLLASATAAVAVLQTVPAALLLGLQRWRQAATAGVVTGGVSAVAVVLLLRDGGGLVTVFAVEAAATATGLVWTSLVARRALAEVAPVPEPAGDLVRKTIALARPAAVLALLDVLVWKRSEFFFLARYAPSAELAMYSVAFAAATAITQLPSALTGIASSFANLHGAGEQDRVRSGFLRAIRLMTAGTIPLTAGTVALGAALIRVVYGDEYGRAATVLLLLVLTLPLLPLFTLADALLVGRGEMRVQVRFTAVAVPVNLVLALSLVPRYGAVGAAVANVGGQLVAGLPLVVRCLRLLGAGPRDLSPSHLLRSVAVAALAGVSARVADDAVLGWAGLFVGAAAFFVVWLAAAAVLRVLRGDDGEWLAEAVGGRLGRGAGQLLRRISSPLG